MSENELIEGFKGSPVQFALCSLISRLLTGMRLEHEPNWFMIYYAYVKQQADSRYANEEVVKVAQRLLFKLQHSVAKDILEIVLKHELPNEHPSDQQCPVCLEELEDSEYFDCHLDAVNFRCQCERAFCRSCAMRHLLDGRNKGTCPMCRTRVIKEGNYHAQ